MSSEVEVREPGARDVERERQRSGRAMQVMFAALSLVMLAVGLAINWFAASAGLPREIVDIAAFSMLLAAVAHATALWLWRV